MRVVFLLPVRTHARYRKRITGLLREGMDCVALYFHREYYPGLCLPCEGIRIGSIDHGKYLSRILPLIRAIPEVHRRTRTADVLYAFGLDQAVLAIAVRSLMKQSGPLVVYEVGDVRELFLRRTLMGSLARFLDHRAVESVDLLVTTSEGFVNGYHRGILQTDPDPYMVVENKVDPSTFPPPRRADDAMDGFRIVIGNFGVLVCPNSWTTLRQIALLRPDRFKIFLAGINNGLEEMEETVQQEQNIEFYGPYVAPKELAELYGRVDLVWGAHYKKERVGDWRWARANRFYEACFYGVPLVAQKETLDAEVVEEYGAGIVVDLREPRAAAEEIAEIDRSDINRWRRNMEKIPKAVYQYSDEHRALAQGLRTIGRRVQLPVGG